MKPRSGSVLPLVLAALALAAIAGGGLLLVGSAETSVGHVSGDVLRVRAGAEASVRSAIAAWDRSAMPLLGPASPVALSTGQWAGPGALSAHASAERIGRALWLVRGMASIDPTGGGTPIAEAAAAALVVSVPPDLPWSGFFAALVSAADVSLDPAAVIDGNSAALMPPGWTAADCPPAASSEGLSIFGSHLRPGLALGPGAALTGTPALLAGTPPLQTGAGAADSAAADWLSPLRFDEAMVGADRFESGAISPGPPAASGPCDQSAPHNWGAPLDPAHPCHDFFPLIAAAGPLAIGPGAGQGILLVNGDLTLLAGAVFYGAILVRGELRAHGGVVHGGVRTLAAGSPLDLRVHASDCALWRAFHRSPALRKAWRPPGRWWLPAAGL